MNRHTYILNRSTLLAKVLRHNPEDINLSYDRYGWFLVLDVLKVLHVDLSTLEEIVNYGKKRRYTFNEDKTKIRAYQGHSFEVDLLLEKSIPNNKLYHGTIVDFYESIMKTGLSKMNRQHVHLSVNKKVAKEVAKRRKRPVIILEINAEEMIKDGFEFFEAENGVWLVDSVPNRYIKKST
jgi:putative RNA 2'-phosphotransferase